MRTLNQQSRAFKQRKGKDMMVSLVSLLTTQRNNVSPHQTFPKSWGGKKSHFYTSFIGSVLSSTKSEKYTTRKQKCRKMSINNKVAKLLKKILDHWFHLHTERILKRIYPWDPRMFKYMKNQSMWYTTLREQRIKSHDVLNKCSNRVWKIQHWW